MNSTERLLQVQEVIKAETYAAAANAKAATEAREVFFQKRADRWKTFQSAGPPMAGSPLAIKPAIASASVPFAKEAENDHCKTSKVYTICHLPYVIAAPGIYKIKKNLKFSPTPTTGNSIQAAITIASSYVKLRFNCNIILQENQVVPNCIGVSI